MTYKSIIGETLSAFGKPVRLTFRQWAHITESHDYMGGNIDKVLETLGNPDYVVKHGTGELITVKHYAKTNITEKYCIVVYREFRDAGFVITAFFTSKPETIKRKGRIIWQK